MVIIVLIRFGTQRGAAHIAFLTILIMDHTITDMVPMDHMIIILTITTQPARLHRDTENQQVIV